MICNNIAKELFAESLQSLISLGRALGVVVHVSELPSSLKSEVSDDAQHSAEVKRRRRADLAWLMTQYHLKEGLAGNYVAVDDKGIVAVGPDEASVRNGAAKSLGVSPEDVLVVPIQVPGSDDAWEAVQADLQLEHTQS